jgi:predicted MFS family arabinose efflux permease
MTTGSGPPGTPARQRLVLAVILVSVFIMPIGISGTAVALPAIARDLGTSPTPLQWVINGFNASFAVCTLAWGIFADRHGYRLTFILGGFVFVASAALSVAARDLYLLDAARVLAGAGAAGVVAGGSAILSSAFAGAARVRAFAEFGTIIGLGLALGPTVAGGLVAAFGWQGVYAATGLIMLVGLAGSPQLPHVESGRTLGQQSVDFSLLRNRRFLGFALVPVAAAVGFVTMLSYLPAALGAIDGMSPARAGLFLLPMTIPVLVGPALAAELIRRVRRVTPVMVMRVALRALLLGDLGLLVLGPGRSLWLAVVPLVLLGLGFGLPVGLVDGEAIASAGPRHSGTAAGVLNFLRVGSEAVSVGVYGGVIAALIALALPAAQAARVAAGQPGHAADYATALHSMLIAMAILVATTAAVSSWLLRTPAAAAAPPEPAQDQALQGSAWSSAGEDNPG